MHVQESEIAFFCATDRGSKELIKSMRCALALNGPGWYGDIGYGGVGVWEYLNLNPLPYAQTPIQIQVTLCSIILLNWYFPFIHELLVLSINNGIRLVQILAKYFTYSTIWHWHLVFH